MKTIKVKTDPKTKECFLNLKDFKNFVDVSKVVYYEFDETDSKNLTLRFFDKNKKLLPTKEKK